MGRVLLCFLSTLFWAKIQAQVKFDHFFSELLLGFRQINTHTQTHIASSLLKTENFQRNWCWFMIYSPVAASLALNFLPGKVWLFRSDQEQDCLELVFKTTEGEWVYSMSTHKKTWNTGALQRWEYNFCRTLNYPGIWIIHIRINRDPPVQWNFSKRILQNLNVSGPVSLFTGRSRLIRTWIIRIPG